MTDVAFEEVRVAINHDSDIVDARQKVRALAAQIGFSGCDQTLIATAISEIARNIVVYARRGEVSLGVVERGGMRGCRRPRPRAGYPGY